MRDFIHVNDVAEAHIKCIPFLKKIKKYHKFNIGIGKEFRYLNWLKNLKKTTGISVPYKFGKRRKGDVAELWSSCKKSNKILNWKPKYKIEDMISSAWDWEKKIILQIVNFIIFEYLY